MSAHLPIDEHVDRVTAALHEHPAVVVEAPPGAGKTTRIPPAIERDRRGLGRVVVLEPRRVAARAAARRMAGERGESVGQTIGITTRGDRRRGAATTIEVVTEGILLNRLQRDPSLPGIGTVVLDEFHERSLDADLSLAFCLESQQAFREDLRLVVMSATLDGDRVATALGGVPVIRTEGRAYPVEIRHVTAGEAAPVDDQTTEVVDAVVELLGATEGDVLVFLPGTREIRRAVDRLRPRVPGDVDVRPLYGALDAATQDAALMACRSGRRKVVVATDIAESSVTVAGVRSVVDAGWSREPRFSPGTGMSRLVTVPASVASADQRAGRAGREGPGTCIRLWTLADHVRRDAAPRPGMATDDLTRAALEVAAWGADVCDLVLLDQPSGDAWDQARGLLIALGALDDAGITAHGRELARMPLHPRLAHMVARAQDSDRLGTAVCIAALLGERDPLRDRNDRDLRTRVELVAGRHDNRVDESALSNVRRERDRLARQLGATGDIEPADVGSLLAMAYPDRIAQARPSRGDFTLASGRGVRVGRGDPLADATYLVVADADDSGERAWIWSAAPVTLDELREHVADAIRLVDVVVWDDDRGDVRAERQERLGAIVLTSTPLQRPSPAAVATAIVEGLRRHGLSLLPWTKGLTARRDRAAFLHRRLGAPWPAVDDDTLLEGLETWLVPYLGDIRRLRDVGADALSNALGGLIGWERRRLLDELAPTGIPIPSGRDARVHYPAEGAPSIEGKLQEFFGPSAHPVIGGEPVVVSLLSPAGRPVHITSDLPGFWSGVYADVRADLRGRYPKHPWPEDPSSATPTAKTKRAQGRS